MSPRTAVDDEWEGEENGDDTLPCPYCRAPIHEDSVRCPRCENYLSAEDAPPERKPLWFVVAAVLCLLTVVGWVLFG